MFDVIISEELKNKAVKHFTEEYEWKYKDVLEVIEVLKQNSYCILGGDILNSKLEYTYDNWYFKEYDNMSYAQSVLESANQTIDYIDRYYKRNGNSYYYILVAATK